jgi:hypothetical protein
MPKVNTNLARSLTGGGGLGTDIFTSALTTGETPNLQRAVVVEVISDPALLTESYKQKILKIVNNPIFTEVMTTNCVIAVLVGPAGGVGPETATILFPFFPSHLMFPIAPGEQVYVIYEDIIAEGVRKGYWMSRIPGYSTFEDPNYTHYDRRFDPTTNPNNYSTKDVDDRPFKPSQEIFQNGGNTPETRTLPQANKENPYNIIFEMAQASQLITPEPVPRWKKRPQELILQGANNSLIMLGEDRNGPVDSGVIGIRLDTTKQLASPREAGAIDIVVGRGRYLPPPSEDPRGRRSDNLPGASSTAPLVIENERGFLETNKNPFRNKLERIANPNEGNPDPIFDAARLYVVQQSRVDENYLLVPGTPGSIVYPEECIANTQPVGTGSLGRSYVVGKADNIRIIARRDEDIAGSILLIREGFRNQNTLSTGSSGLEAPTEPDGDLAYMYFSPDGKIQIEANKIYFGRVGVENENDNLPEPYIRYTVYKATIESLQSQISNLADHVKELENIIFEAFSGATNVAPYGPVPSLIQKAPNILSHRETLDPLLDVDSKRENMETYVRNAASTKIYGE